DCSHGDAENDAKGEITPPPIMGDADSLGSLAGEACVDAGSQGEWHDAHGGVFPHPVPGLTDGAARDDESRMSRSGRFRRARRGRRNRYEREIFLCVIGWCAHLVSYSLSNPTTNTQHPYHYHHCTGPGHYGPAYSGANCSTLVPVSQHQPRNQGPVD